MKPILFRKINYIEKNNYLPNANTAPLPNIINCMKIVGIGDFIYHNIHKICKYLKEKNY